MNNKQLADYLREQMRLQEVPMSPVQGVVITNDALRVIIDHLENPEKYP